MAKTEDIAMRGGADPTRRFAGSLKARLGIGAGYLGLVALLAAVVTIAGMDRVAERLDAALATEHRIDLYAVLTRFRS